MNQGILDYMGLQPYTLPLTAQMGEAVSKWLKHRHPRDTAKLIAREVGADPKTVENILAGHLSAASLTRLIRAYGWPFLAAIGAATIGETHDQWINRELEEIADERRRLDEMEAGLRGSWARARARRSVDAGGLRLVTPEDDVASWAPRGAPGGVGSDQARRKG